MPIPFDCGEDLRRRSPKRDTFLGPRLQFLLESHRIFARRIEVVAEAEQHIVRGDVLNLEARVPTANVVGGPPCLGVAKIQITITRIECEVRG